jgi:hypothetical protein
MGGAIKKNGSQPALADTPTLSGAPVVGESVTQYDGLTQSFNTKIFDGVGWEDPDLNPVADPSLAVMEPPSLVWTLMEAPCPLPSTVPEPGAGTLLLVCGMLFKLLSSYRKR